MKTLGNPLTICIAAFILALLGVPFAESEEGSTPTALAVTPEWLVSHSPWSGTWNGVGTNYRGTLELVFSFREGKLLGEVRNLTGTSVGEGVVSYLEVAEGTTVKFQIPRTGTNYELSINERGQLEGKGKRRTGTTTEVVLTPALKGTAK